MAGFGSALGHIAAGMANAYGTTMIANTMEEAKDKRAAQMEQLRIASAEGIAARQNASSERMQALAQQTNLKLGEMSTAAQVRGQDVSANTAITTTGMTTETSKAINAADIEATGKNLDKELENRKEIALASETGATKRTQAQIDASQKLAELQQAGAWTPTLINVKDDKGGTTQQYVLTNGAGKYKEMPLGKDGKPIDLVGTDTDTEDARNYKFMISHGIDDNTATKLAFGSKLTDPLGQATAVFKALNDAQSANVKPLSPEETATNWEQAKAMTGYTGPMPGAEGAGAAGATTAPATLPPKPEGVGAETLVAQAKKWVTDGKYSAAYVKQVLTSWGIDPATAGLK